MGRQNFELIVKWMTVPWGPVVLKGLTTHEAFRGPGTGGGSHHGTRGCVDIADDSVHVVQTLNSRPERVLRSAANFTADHYIVPDAVMRRRQALC